MQHFVNYTIFEKIISVLQLTSPSTQNSMHVYWCTDRSISHNLGTSKPDLQEAALYSGVRPYCAVVEVTTEGDESRLTVEG